MTQAIPVEAPSLKGLKLGVIGAGVMGKTLIRGMLDARMLEKDGVLAAVNTQKSKKELETGLGVRCAVGYLQKWIPQTDIFLICTKPHKVPGILMKLRDSKRLKPRALVISIAAGISIAQMEAVLPHHPVIRAMPNTPCLVQAGAIVIAPGNQATRKDLGLASQIFSSVGTCLELEEHHLNAVTAVSGSGPAYAYLIMEALADGAVKVGLPRDVAFQLVSQTMLGSALMLQKTGKHPAMLKDEVTTPSGCTISALLTLEDGNIRSTLARAVEEATRTAAGLGLSD